MKRFAQSDPTPGTNDNAVFKSKRIIAGSPFDSNRAEQPSRETSLDEKRAEELHQHVRALNKQFASWVQLQLQHHPDGLWQDGVQDYITHALGILEKYSDIVAWIKANAAKGESVTSIVAHGTDNKSMPEVKKPELKFASNNNSVFGLAGPSFGTDKKLVPEAKNHEVKFQSNKNSVFGLPNSTFGAEKPEAKNHEVKFQPNNNTVFGLSGSTFGCDKKLAPEEKNSEVKFQLNNNSVFGQAGLNANSASPWGSSMTSNSPSPFMFGGSQTPLSVNRQASDDADAEDEVEQPSSPSVKKTEEKEIIVVHIVKCKLYVKSTDPADKEAWKDKGVGQLSIRCKEGVSKATKESKPTLIVRNDAGKVLLNALLYPGIKTNKQKTAIVAIFHTSVETDGDNKVVAQTYLLRTKSEADRDKLASMIQEYAPAA